MTTKLLERFEVAHNTMAFRLAKPPGWEFRPGQSLDLTLLNPPETDTEGNTRAFSIASPPQDPTLLVATRMRDTAFKRVLKSLPIGSGIGIAGPFGSFSLHNQASRPSILLAGGIGITPFHSIALHAAREKLPHRIILFYSNRRPEDAAFLDELRSLHTQNPNFKLVATMTGTHDSWNGETGHIDKAMLHRYVAELDGAICYIAGPPSMVKGLTSVLPDWGVDTDDIRSEEFAGY